MKNIMYDSYCVIFNPEEDVKKKEYKMETLKRGRGVYDGESGGVSLRGQQKIAQIP